MNYVLSHIESQSHTQLNNQKFFLSKCYENESSRTCTFIISFGQVHKGFRWIGPNHSLFTLNIKTGILSEENLKQEQRDLGKLQVSELLQSELPGDFDIHAFYKAESLLITVPGTEKS